MMLIRSNMQRSISHAVGRGLSRRSFFARAVGWLAGLIGFGVLLVFLAQAGFFDVFLPQQKQAPISIKADRLIIAAPVINGLDKENLPYRLSAQSAEQDPHNTQLIFLDQVTARFQNGAEHFYDLRAKTGLYNRELKLLDLEGDIVLTEPGRLTAYLRKAHMNVRAKNMTSDQPVLVKMARGVIRANSMQMHDNGDRILFDQGVRAQFGLQEAEIKEIGETP